ncbi:MAG: zinc-ribbon domain-containing protein, partial [Acidobacteria bacterium]|nr:zinc-ribbon domain-containing protein [Acidobacteriota bacterium]
MIIQCPSCTTRYHYDETRFQGVPAKKIKCTKCSSIFEIRNPSYGAAPTPADFNV